MKLNENQTTALILINRCIDALEIDPTDPLVQFAGCFNCDEVHRQTLVSLQNRDIICGFDMFAPMDKKSVWVIKFIPKKIRSLVNQLKLDMGEVA